MRKQVRSNRPPAIAISIAMLVGLIAPVAVSANEVLVISEDTVLEADHAGSIVIDTSGVTLDCAGHSVTGDGSGTGIEIGGASQVTITGCAVSGFGEGIRISSGDHNAVVSNDASANETWGVIAVESVDASVVGNVVHDNALIGIALNGAISTTVEGNEVADNGEGISVDSSDGSLVARNVLRSNVEAGLHIFFSDGGIYEKNVAIHNGSGFALNAAAHNTLRQNRAIGNGGVGFHAFFGSVENRFEDNVACQNQFFDALDASEPSGTNTWTDNHLCQPLAFAE